MLGRTDNEPLNNRTKELSRPARRLDHTQRTKITIGRITGQVEQHLDNPPTRKYLAMVLISRHFKRHRNHPRDMYRHTRADMTG